MSQVAPHIHEADAWLYYGPVESGNSDASDYDGLDPYWALADLLINECDGYTEVSEIVIDGEVCDLRLNYSTSGIAPRPRDPVDSDTLYEFDIHVDGEGERKCNFNVSPRFPGMRKPDGEKLTFPFHHSAADEGVSVHAQPSNIDLDELPGLLARAIFELADDAGVGLYHGYFDAPFDGHLTAVERYLRLTRSMNEKLIGTGSVFDRLTMLLSDADGTVGEYKWDNEEERGHHHALRHGSVSAQELVPQHRLGGQIKSYLPENPENFSPDDPLYHPKLGVKFTAGRTATGSVAWADRHDVIRELDERLLSLLSWAGVPVDAGGTTFVADDHFEAAPAESSVPIHGDPLPRLEAQQEHLLMTVLRDMAPSDRQLTETLATDGGMHAQELADATDTSVSTVYRMLQRLEGVITSDNGHVRFVSEKLRQEVRGLVESVEHAIDSAADRAAHLVDIDVRQSASSAFDRWLAKYGAEFDAPEYEGQRPVVRIDTVLSEYKSTNQPLVGEVIGEMVRAWKKDGRDPATVLDAIVAVSIDGTQYERPVRTLR
ncbi:winged helix-turn-helix domain-containing protein [Haloarcula sebkhae]|uniref:Helix-turn-helix domain-containing protein n=2 Tax=Haloarcula sebkhae TaxID=932660 RepID=A0ACC6VQ80_9EURY|nr:winged helix-turn-helix domain-containing protein [Haloarcula sebkhae]GGK64507.1 hypothetical protein GCM10009067_16180 [Haloarcula sebkhae]